VKYLIVFAIFFSALSCGSKKYTFDSNSDSYYQFQISPADGAKSLFIHIEIPQSLVGKELEELIVNKVEVPYIYQAEDGYVELFIRDYPQANSNEEKESTAIYQELRQQDSYMANLKLGSSYLVIPDLKELESQELELMAPPRSE
jgi:hypothetical protein